MDGNHLHSMLNCFYFTCLFTHSSSCLWCSIQNGNLHVILMSSLVWAGHYFTTSSLCLSSLTTLQVLQWSRVCLIYLGSGFVVLGDSTTDTVLLHESPEVLMVLIVSQLRWCLQGSPWEKKKKNMVYLLSKDQMERDFETTHVFLSSHFCSVRMISLSSSCQLQWGLPGSVDRKRWCWGWDQDFIPVRPVLSSLSYVPNPFSILNFEILLCLLLLLVA